MTEPMDLTKLQRLLEAAEARWQAADTPVSVLADVDKRRRLGADFLRTMARRGASAEAHARAAVAGYPPDFDWRNKGGQDYVTAVEDQGNCGSCVAFGTVATVEATLQVQQNDPTAGIDLSEAQVFYCYGGQAGVTCETGWWPDDAYKAIQAGGVVDVACFPYTAGDQSCNLCGDAASRTVNINGWQSATDIGKIKNLLSTAGPLSTCFTVYDDFFSYGGGIYHHVTGNVAGGHCVCVVGYSDTDGCWICKNSWGPGWGDGGFFSIAYGECGIDAEMWAVS